MCGRVRQGSAASAHAARACIRTAAPSPCKLMCVCRHPDGAMAESAAARRPRRAGSRVIPSQESEHVVVQGVPGVNAPAPCIPGKYHVLCPFCFFCIPISRATYSKTHSGTRTCGCTGCATAASTTRTCTRTPDFLAPAQRPDAPYEVQVLIGRQHSRSPHHTGRQALHQVLHIQRVGQPVLGACVRVRGPRRTESMQAVACMPGASRLQG